MSKILKKSTAGDFFITDMGVTVPGEGELTIDPSMYTLLYRSEDVVLALSSGDLVYNDGSSDLSLVDAIDHIRGYSQKSPVTEDGRYIVADNRIPPGYSITVVGDSDDISNNTFGGGDEFILDAANTIKYIQFLKHWYAIGALADFENSSMDVYVNSTLFAPATQGLTVATGDYIVAGGVLIVPVAVGTGDRSLDLTAKIGSSDVLKCTPVPASGNNGWFDYDDATNVLTRNVSQQGGYNLYTIDIPLHAFSRRLKASSYGKQVHAPGLVGKLLYNTWKIKLELKIRTGSLTSEKVGIDLIAGMKGNI